MLLLLSSLATQKYLQYSIGIATEQSFRYTELTDAKIWISKNASLCCVLANRVQIFAVLNVVITAIEERCNQSGYAIYKH